MTSISRQEYSWIYDGKVDERGSCQISVQAAKESKEYAIKHNGFKREKFGPLMVRTFKADGRGKKSITPWRRA